MARTARNCPVRRPDDESALAEFRPARHHHLGARVQRTAPDVEVLELAGAGVARAADGEHRAAGEQRGDRIAAEVRVARGGVGPVAAEQLAGVELGGRADVAALGVEDDRHVRMAVSDVRTHRLERSLRALRREMGDLRLEGADEIGGRVDDGETARSHRARRRARPGAGPDRGRARRTAATATQSAARSLSPKLTPGMPSRLGFGGAVAVGARPGRGVAAHRFGARVAPTGLVEDARAVVDLDRVGGRHSPPRGSTRPRPTSRRERSTPASARRERAAPQPRRRARVPERQREAAALPRGPSVRRSEPASRAAATASRRPGLAALPPAVDGGCDREPSARAGSAGSNGPRS